MGACCDSREKVTIKKSDSKNVLEKVKPVITEPDVDESTDLDQNKADLPPKYQFYDI